MALDGPPMGLESDLVAQLVAENVALQLERRISFRRAMKRSMQSARRLGAKGVRINVSGRLGGAEIARIEALRRAHFGIGAVDIGADAGSGPHGDAALCDQRVEQGINRHHCLR